MNIGDKMPSFSLLEVDDKHCNNYDYADKYAMAVIFAGNECKYVKAYWNRIVKLKQRYEEDNLAILCINSNDASSNPAESFERMKEVAKEVGIFPVYLLDSNQEMAKAFGAKCTPEVFLFNSKRELVYHGAIDDCWDNENNVTRVYLEDAIEYALDGIEVDFPEIPAKGCNITWKE
jgi:thioredoxin-related protein